MVAFTWTITTVLTLFAFVTAVVLTVQVHTHYASLKRYYQGDDWYVDDDGAYNYNNNGNGEGQEGGEDQEHNNERNEEYQNAIRESYLQLASMNGTRSITFVAVYCMLLATGLCLYGSMAIVGFTSLRGVYISPCFDNHPSGDKMKVGMFGGAIVLFANLLLVCAVVLGEVRVSCVALVCILSFDEMDGNKWRQCTTVHHRKLINDDLCALPFASTIRSRTIEMTDRKKNRRATEINKRNRTRWNG